MGIHLHAMRLRQRDDVPARRDAAAGTQVRLRNVDRAGTEVRNDMRVCPGRYRIADAKQKGVLVVAVSGVRLDLSGVVLESGGDEASGAPLWVGDEGVGLVTQAVVSP